LVSIIVLNYNGKDYLKECLSSLAKASFKNFEIIFVDNASSDDSVEYVNKLKQEVELPNLTIVRNPTNLGYSGGNNIGIKKSCGVLIVLLNNDTSVVSNWLKELVKAALANRSIGIFQSKILFEDGKTIQSAGNLIDIYGAVTCRGLMEEDNGQFDVSVYCFSYVSGACMMIRKEVLNDIGCFDEKLFLGQDDVDLNWRAMLRGYQKMFVPKAICVHKGSATVEKLPSNFLLYYEQRNRIRVLMKNYSIIRLVRRLPLALTLTALTGFRYCLGSRDVRYLLSIVKAYLWNLKNLKDTLSERKKLQSRRMVSDAEIEKHLLPYSLEIISLREKLGKLLFA